MTNSNSAPPSLLSFAKSSPRSDKRLDDDRAVLLPSQRSSFNLTGDSEVLTKSERHLSNVSSSSSSYKRGNSGLRDKKKISKRHYQQHQLQQIRHSSSASRISDRRSKNIRVGSDGGSPSIRKQRSLPLTSETAVSTSSTCRIDSYEANHSGNFSGSSFDGNEESYYGGEDSDNPSGSLKGQISSNSSFGGCQQRIPENNESIRSARSIKSVKSSKSGRSEASSLSGKSPRSSKSSLKRKRIRRAEKLHEWHKKKRRRRLLGFISLTMLYSLLFAYTLLIMLGPLALHFLVDQMEWCPYYNGEKLENRKFENSGFTVVDLVHKFADSVGHAGSVADPHHGGRYKRRGLVSHEEMVAREGFEMLNVDMLEKTSKDVHIDSISDGGGNSSSKYENPDFDSSICRIVRIPFLFYLTLEECDLSRRMAASLVFGGFIGYERRASDRPAGIRTMALVSLGSCFFTLSSQFAFRDSPMTWDASRVSAAIPSGVGFLGAGLIWKGSLNDGNGGEVHQVHGITTAASLWLAAAVGVGSGGALYTVTAYSTALVILVLRFGPRLFWSSDNEVFEHDDDDDDTAKEDDEYSVSDNEREPNDVQKESSDFEMHALGNTSREIPRYGATDGGESAISPSFRENQIIKIERMIRAQSQKNLGIGQMGGSERSNTGNQISSWLNNLLPWKNNGQQHQNPYQELINDREVMQLLRKRKSLSKLSSRPSICT